MKYLAIVIAALPTLGVADTVVDLNTLAQQGDACRMTFTVQTDVGLSALETQTVLFDGSGAVRALTVFDFGEVPADGLRVRQFDMPATVCSDVDLVLFNGVERCAAIDGAPCAETPLFSSRVDTVEVKQ